MYPSWNPESPSLLPTFVCYADILGFRALTERAYESGEAAEFLGKIKRSLAVAYKIVRDTETAGWDSSISILDMKVFTDNIVVAYPLREPHGDLGEPELGHLLTIFSYVQACLALEGFFVRGAIAFGDHYQDDDVAYGKTLLEAVDFDKSGSPPSLVIAPSVEPLILTHLSWYGYRDGTPHHAQLLEDPSGCRLFVNYLHTAFDYFPEGPINHQLLAAHGETVRRALVEYESNPSVRAKYEWLAVYHNYVCRTFAEPYSYQGGEDADPEQIAIAVEAQSVLEHMVPLDRPLSIQPPQPLDARRLSKRLKNRKASG